MNLLSAIFILCVSFSLSSSNCLPSSCAEIFVQGNTESGIYTIHPRAWYSPYPFQVYCDMKTDGGGWTVFQKRDDYEIRENFERNWQNYKIGFGDLNKEFWLGNEYLYFLTNQDRVTLRIDLEDFEGNSRKAEYRQFLISDEKNNYKLGLSEYSGDAGDSLGHVTGALFTTTDKNDVNGCSKNYKGGWWYTNCHQANLNGLYLKGNHTSYADGINWYQWLGHHYSLKRTEMKVRPINFLPHTNLQLE